MAKYLNKRRPRRFRRRFRKMSLQKRVMRIIKPEYKYAYFGGSNINMSTTMTFSTLVGISQGDTLTTRTGNRIAIHQMECRAEIFARTTATDSYNVRFGIFKFNQGSDTPTEGNIWNNGTVSTYSGALRQGSYMDQYKILWDKITAVNVATTSGSTKNFHYFKKFKYPQTIQYFSTGTTDLMKDSFYFYQVSETSTADQMPIISWMVKVRYTDS